MLKLIESENEANEGEAKSFSDLMNYWKTVEDDTKFLARFSYLEVDGSQKETKETKKESKKGPKKTRNRPQKITANDVEEIFGLSHRNKSTGSHNVFKKYFTKLFN